MVSANDFELCITIGDVHTIVSMDGINRDGCDKVSINNIAKDGYDDGIAVSLDGSKHICGFVAISMDDGELYIAMEGDICVNGDDRDINDKVLVDSIAGDGCDNCIIVILDENCCDKVADA